MRRIHSERVRPFLFAAFVNGSASAFVNPMGTILPLASPLGQFGPSGFAFLLGHDFRIAQALPVHSSLIHNYRNTIIVILSRAFFGTSRTRAQVFTFRTHFTPYPNPTMHSLGRGSGRFLFRPSGLRFTSPAPYFYCITIIKDVKSHKSQRCRGQAQ